MADNPHVKLYHDLRAWLDSAFPGAAYIGPAGTRSAPTGVDIAWVRFDARGAPVGGPLGRAAIRAPHDGVEVTATFSFTPDDPTLRVALAADVLLHSMRWKFKCAVNVAEALPLVQAYFYDAAILLQDYVCGYQDIPFRGPGVIRVGQTEYTNAITTTEENDHD